MNLAERLPAGGVPRAAGRMADIEPFHVMQIIARAKALEAQGRSIVNMVVGEPDFPVAPLVRDAALRVLETGHLHYTPALGITPLREAVSAWYRTRYDVQVPPSRIAVTTGSSGALLITMGVLLDPGQEVLMADPGYPCNRHFVRTMDGVAVGVAVGPDTAYQLTAELVEQHWSAAHESRSGLLAVEPDRYDHLAAEPCARSMRWCGRRAASSSRTRFTTDSPTARPRRPRSPSTTTFS